MDKYEAQMAVDREHKKKKKQRKKNLGASKIGLDWESSKTPDLIGAVKSWFSGDNAKEALTKSIKKRKGK